jgi:hypothetical protein
MLTDTSPEIAAAQRKLWRESSPEKRLRHIAALVRSVRSLTWQGLRHKNSGFDESRLTREFLRRVYPRTFENETVRTMANVEVPMALLPVVTACERLGLAYRIGGSLSSSLHGEPRATNDADIVIDLKPSDAKPFVEALGDGYIIDADSFREAIARSRSITALHIDTVFKIDIFPLKARAFDRQAHQRAILVPIEQNGERFELRFATAEDILLAKTRMVSRRWRGVGTTMAGHCGDSARRGRYARRFLRRTLGKRIGRGRSARSRP